MDISHSTALVTGANRGLGREFARQLVERGAATVFATARRPETIDLPGVVPLALDITDVGRIREVAAQAADVSLLVNNAGVSTRVDLLDGDPDQIRLEFDTHVWGTLDMIRAFAPVLAGQGGGAVVNVMSALSFIPFRGAGAYSVAKTAEWQLTNNLRLDLADQHTQVLGAHLAATDTDMMAGYDGPMNDPADVVRVILDGLEAGLDEVLVDQDTRKAKQAMSGLNAR